MGATYISSEKKQEGYTYNSKHSSNANEQSPTLTGLVFSKANDYCQGYSANPKECGAENCGHSHSGLLYYLNPGSACLFVYWISTKLDLA
jgi:hypothetical protein